MRALKSSMPQVIEKLRTTHFNRKWAFCILGQWFYPHFRQILFIRERTLSSTILVAFGHVKWEKASLPVDVPRVIYIRKSSWTSPNSVLVTAVLLKTSHMVLIFVT